MSINQAKTVKVAIVGTGNAARQHVKKFRLVPGCEIVAGVDVAPGKAEAFCKERDIPHAFTSLEELFAETDCDAVSVVTSDAYHAQVAIAALEADKHVLCEKPLALNYGDAAKMVEVAQKAQKVNMVNFSYRSWSALDLMAKQVRGGVLGEIRHVEASYYQSWLSNDIWGDWRNDPAKLWRLSTKHGGSGALGDVGVHLIDFVTFPAGDLSRISCTLKTFEKVPGNQIGEYVLDANDTAVITAEFKNGATGVLQTSRWATGHANRLYLKIFGTRGAAELDSDHSTTGIRISDNDLPIEEKWRTLEADPVVPIHERFITAIQNGTPFEPDFAQGAKIQKALDACFASHIQKASIDL